MLRDGSNTLDNVTPPPPNRKETNTQVDELTKKNRVNLVRKHEKDHNRNGRKGRKSSLSHARYVKQNAFDKRKTTAGTNRHRTTKHIAK